MIFEQFDLALEGDSYKKYRGMQIIKPKAFQEHADRLEKEEQAYVSIIRNTWLKMVKDKDVEKRREADEDMLRIGDAHYELSKSRDWPCAGYIAVSRDRFIRVERNILLLILWVLLFFILVAGSISVILGLKSCSVTNAWDPDIDQSAQEYTGKLDDVPVEQESIVVPGFYRFTATEGGNSLQLHNPDGNTVYFQYDIYLVDDVRTAASFPDLDSAQAFVEEHSAEYGCRPEGDGYVLCDADGNAMGSVTLYRAVGNGTGFDVLEEEVSALYQTKLIGPGQQVLWDAYHGLGLGTHQIKLKVSTYDIETGAECYGAIQTVEAEVK